MSEQEQQSTKNSNLGEVTSEGYSLYESESLKKDETASESETPEKDTKANDLADVSDDAEGELSENDESTDDESEKDESEHKEERPRKKNGFKKRIERFQKQLSSKDQEIEHWKSEALKSKSQPKNQSEVEGHKNDSQDNSKRPKPEDFETFDQYNEALTDWKIDQREMAKDRKTKEESLKSEYQKTVTTFQERVKEFEKANADFHDVLSDVDDIPLSVGLQEVVLSSESGPELIYELAKNREEYERINKLSPLMIAREIGRLEARLSSKQETKQQTITKSKAPPPMNPLSGSSGSGIKKRPDQMTGDEYLKWRQQNKG